MLPETMGETERATILVVDDDPRGRQLAAGYLKASYSVVEAENGPAAIELSERSPVDLVLLDVMMPGMSGFEVCQKLKGRSDGTFLPVLLLTALGEQEHRNQGLEVGADDFLTKPVDRRELSLRVRAFLKIRQQEKLIRGQMAHLKRLTAFKDDLVSLLVHDIRNPLNAVLLNLILVGREAAKDGRPALCEPLRRTEEAARRISDRLGELLDVRLLEEGELKLQAEPVALESVLTEAVSSFDAAARSWGVTLEVSAENGAVALADVKLLQRAVENLLANAIRYSPRGQAVSVRALALEGGAEIAVADRGPGVPDSFKRKIFDRFGSVEGREERQGHGLGLYLVRLVTAAHGGRAWVEDRDGGGATFRLFFPTGGPPSGEVSSK